MAQQLAAVPDDRIAKILETERARFAGDADDFVQWVRDWQKFLEVCGGYDAD